MSLPLSWLWPGRLAFGKLALLEGDPGVGKSLLTLELCARLTTGRPFPDGRPGPGVGNAIIVSGEDGMKDTIRPRLEAFGADLERVFELEAGDRDGRPPLGLPSRLGVLHDALTETRARLVVIDPVTDFLDPGVNPNSELSVRRALDPLRILAEHFPCVVLLLRHLNKTGGWRSLYRGGGSIAFQALCRSSWLLAPDPADPRRRVLAQVKNNYAPPQPSLAYAARFADGAPPALSWLGESPLTSDQLLAGAARPPEVPRARAKEFLAAVLEDGPRTTREIWALAEPQGLSERTLRRARQELDACSHTCTVDGRRQTYWRLPRQELPDHIPGLTAVPSVEAWLAALQQQYPPPTPLDDDWEDAEGMADDR